MKISNSAFTGQKVINFTESEARNASQEAVFGKFSEDKYSTNLVPLLEEYLDEQIKDVSFDIDANLHLLKLYKMFPETSKTNRVVQVLTKSMMGMASGHYSACMHAFPESMIEDESIESLIKAAEFLSSCKFQAFWKEPLLFASGIPEFEDCIRSYIIMCLQISHESVSAAFAKEQLNVDDSELKTIAQGRDWTIEKEKIIIPSTGETEAGAKKVKKEMDFGKMQQVIKVLSE